MELCLAKDLSSYCKINRTKIADVSASPSPSWPSSIENCVMNHGTKDANIDKARGGKKPCMKLVSVGLRRKTGSKNARTLVMSSKSMCIGSAREIISYFNEKRFRNVRLSLKSKMR